jgi:serine/threonine protein kinase
MRSNTHNLAHSGAYKHAHILHRDLSPGNIIIDSNGRGLLIDWDLSKPVTGISETPRRITRTVRINPW